MVAGWPIAAGGMLRTFAFLSVLRRHEFERLAAKKAFAGELAPFLINANIPLCREQRKRSGFGMYRLQRADAPLAVTMKSRESTMLGLILDSLIT
jgi:hypothetical protein